MQNVRNPRMTAGFRGKTPRPDGGGDGDGGDGGSGEENKKGQLKKNKQLAADTGIGAGDNAA